MRSFGFGIAGFVGLLSFVSLAACGGGVPAKGTSSASADVAQKETEGLEVLEPGAEPRVARHYAFKAGKVGARSVIVKEAMSQDGQPPVDRTQTWRIQVTTLAVEAGRARLEVKLLGFDVPQDASPAEREEIGKAIGSKVVFEVDDHGTVGNLEGLEVPGPGPLRTALLETMATFIEMLAPPLPVRPIGVGAKWQQQSTPRPGLTERRLYRLSAATADESTIVEEQTATLTRQQVEGAKTEVFQSANAEGKATYVIGTGEVAKTTHGSLTTTMRVEVPSSPQQVTRNTRSYDVASEPAK